MFESLTEPENFVQLADSVDVVEPLDTEGDSNDSTKTTPAFATVADKKTIAALRNGMQSSLVGLECPVIFIFSRNLC